MMSEVIQIEGLSHVSVGYLYHNRRNGCMFIHVWFGFN